MQFLTFDQKPEGLNLLCLGAHSDDIEIGAGGTLLSLFKKQKVNKVRWVVFASNEVRKQEAEASAAKFLEGVNAEISVFSFRDAFLNFSALEIKERFEQIKKGFEPDVVFTHYRNDRHQDHRLLSDLAWNTFRNHLIFEYEIPKYDGDLGNPNCFFHIDQEAVDKKVEILLECFPTQVGKHWFDRETFLALMRIRGMESASPSRYAEAFHARKFIM